MREQPFLPRRRSVRLPLFDYTQPAAYFLTICVQDMKPLFGKVIGNDVALNQAGRIPDQCWRSIPRHFDRVELGPYVIMPDHVHGIVIVRPAANPKHRTVGASVNSMDVESIAKESRRARYIVPLQPENPVRQFGVPATGSIATIVAAFKAGLTRQVGRRLHYTRASSLWQRGYHEHIIRDQDDFRKVCEYIRTNAIRQTFKNEFQRNHLAKAERSKT